MGNIIVLQQQQKKACYKRMLNPNDYSKGTHTDRAAGKNALLGCPSPLVCPSIHKAVFAPHHCYFAAVYQRKLAQSIARHIQVHMFRKPKS